MERGRKEEGREDSFDGWVGGIESGVDGEEGEGWGL
jgi:hypothetical protein